MPRSTGRHCLLRPGVHASAQMSPLPMKTQTWATSMALKVVCSAIPSRFSKTLFQLVEALDMFSQLSPLNAFCLSCFMSSLMASWRLLESMWKNLSNTYPLFLIQSVRITQMLLSQDTRYVWVLQCGHLTFALCS